MENKEIISINNKKESFSNNIIIDNGKSNVAILDKPYNDIIIPEYGDDDI